MAASQHAAGATTHGGNAAAVTIPDAHLMFGADYTRDGSDLLLRGEHGETFTVHNYFATDHRPRLLSPEGAELSADIVSALAGSHVQYAQAGAPSPAADAVGRVATVSGNSTIIRNGVAMTAKAGDVILKGDVLQTGTGALGVTFNDGSTVNLTANARLVVNEFIYDPNSNANSQILNLVQGGLTFISGEVAHHGDMRIGTPVATMGIRGTVGGVTNSNDGTVQFYVSQSETGAVIIDRNGTVIANVTQNGPLIVVQPAGPLLVLATELQKSPQELAAELSALQQIVNIQSIGQQIIQQFLAPTQNTPNAPTRNGTQIQIDLQKTENSDSPGNGGGTFTGAVVTTTTPPPPGGGAPATTTTAVSIPQAQSPLNFGPQQQSVDEDHALVFSAVNQNAISVFDGDTTILTVTVSVTHGTITLNGTSGLTFSVGTGAADTTVTFSGTQQNINAALDGLTFSPDHDYSGAASLSVSTNDGTTTTGETVAITVNPVNDAPVVSASSVSVSEEGLSSGLPDMAGTGDTTNSATASGTIIASDVDSGVLTFTFGQPATPLTSNGVTVTWTGDGTGTLIGKAGAATIITLSIDAHSGAYTVTLSGPIDHPGAGEDVKAISVPVNVSDGQATTITTLSVNVEDDSPVAANDALSVKAGIPQSTANIVIILDVSGSMGTIVSGSETRLQLAQAAIDNLLSTANVQINQVMAVSFSAAATVHMVSGSPWTSAASAQSFIDGVSTGGGTNYTAAINAVESAWNAQAPSSADKTIVYFISDGEPTAGQGLSASDQMVWESFLADQHVDTAYAIGISTNATDSDLTPIAWASTDPNFSPVVLSSVTGLDSTLQNTVPDAPTKNIFSDAGGSAGFGADGGHIVSVTVDGVTYTWDGASTITKSGAATGTISGNSISLDTDLGGHFKFYFASGGGHFAGDWSYLQPNAVMTTTDEVFHYVLVDHDGDTAGADITVTVAPSADPIVVDLGAHGLALTSAATSPVAFDLNGDGVKELTGWTSGEDGLLVVDLDHSGAIENGREIVSPYFNGGGFKTSLEALASFDTNHDGVIDGRDAGFTSLEVWQDRNHDGISQPGELASLADLGVTSIDLNTSVVSQQADGQDVTSVGNLGLAGGGAGAFYAVAFDSSTAGTNLLVGTAAADAFVFKPGDGAASVVNFSGAAAGGDQIVLDHFSFVDFADLQGHLHDIDVGNGLHNTVIDLGGGDSVTLYNVAANTLTAHDFIFHHDLVG